MGQDSITGLGTGRAVAPGLAPASEVPFTQRCLGGLSAVATDQVTAETELWNSEDIPAAEMLNLYLNFHIVVGGVISSDGSDNIALDLNWVEPDGTTVTLCAITTVGLANEQDVNFVMDFIGRVITAGASGFMAASGRMTVNQGTALYFSGGDAGVDGAGISVDLSNGGHFQLTGTWDGIDGSLVTTISVNAVVATCNSRGGR